MKSNDEFIKQLNIVHDRRITPLQRYMGNKRKILFKCNVCENEWETTPGNILKTKNCPVCAINKRDKTTLTHQEFINNAKERLGEVFNEYKILGKYKGMKQKIKIKHKECGYEWDIAPGNFYNIKKMCPLCNGRVNGKQSEERSKSGKKSNEQFKEELKKVFDKEYTQLEEYQGLNNKIMVRHEKCGYEWKARGGTLLRGHGCPKCAGIYQRTSEDYERELDEKFNGKLKLVSTFIKIKSNVTIKCNECGELFNRNAGYLINNSSAVGCPSCSPTSSGEEVVRQYLKSNSIHYISQYSIKINNQTLRFDFAVYNEDKIITFIEYNGEQHYKPVSIFGGEKALENQKLRDNLKRKYCRENKIDLIEIPYTVNEIEGYLENNFDIKKYQIQLALII